jgi:hypothetical protein
MVNIFRCIIDGDRLDFMSEKSELIEKARKLGSEYLPVYRECAPTTLLAVADTLNMKVSDDLFKAMVGLSGPSGGCGGICGATAAIGLRYGVDREVFVSDSETRGRVHGKILKAVKVVRDRFVETYGGYLCYDVQKKLFGIPFDFIIPEELEAFREGPTEKCRQVTENAAGWTVEALLEAE